MATYKELHGRSIAPVSANPSTSGDAGKIFYNSTDNVFRSIVSTEAWSATSNTNTAKQRSGGCGTQIAGLNCGGFNAPPNGAAHDGTEEYNGSGWSTGGTLNTARGNTKLVGIQTAAVFFGQGGGGQPQSGVTEEYNGTSWTTVNPMANAINYRSGCGIESALLATGGNVPGTNRTTENEEYDGTNWTSGGALPQRQSSQGQAGTQTAAINSFGYTNSPVPSSGGDAFNAISLEYDGSSWTAGPNGNGVVQLSGYAMGSGTQTDAIFASGPPTNSCKYDGTTFTVGPALAIAQDSSSHGSTSASATWIAKGSPVPSIGSRTQEFNRSTDVITAAAAWASGGNLNNSRDEGASSQNGLQTAALYFGGYKTDPAVSYTEEYNGSAWSAKNAINTARYSGAGAGTTTAALYSGGFSNPSTRQSAVEEFDGTNWSTQPNSLSTGRNNCGGCGTQTAGLVFGGDEPADSDKTELYNGTSWTNGGTLSTARSHVMGGVGISTLAICVGGKTPGSSYVATTEEYGGSSWTSGGNLLTGTENGGGAGTATDAIIFGGNTGPGAPNYTSATQGYDGTAFSTRPSLATARVYVSGTGTSTAGVAFGGNAPPYTTATEEFTGETTSVNVKTITTS
jgi:hypothetical protein